MAGIKILPELLGHFRQPARRKGYEIRKDRIRKRDCYEDNFQWNREFPEE